MLLALILTILIEWVVMWLLTHSINMCKYNLYCNLVSNPLFNLFMGFTGYLLNSRLGLGSGLCYFIPFFIGEPLVFWFEMKIYMLITYKDRRECLRLSVITNGISAIAGVIWFITTLIHTSNFAYFIWKRF